MNKVWHNFNAKIPVIVIGGAVGDIILPIERLPHSGQDIESQTEIKQVSGCAFNVALALCRLGVTVINGMPVGKGIWASQIERAMTELGLKINLRNPERDNGWCIALVEPNGERTFITTTGCEAIWSEQLLKQLPVPNVSIIYANGYELVGERGRPLRQWLLNQSTNHQLFIDFGPRINAIEAEFIQQLYQRDVILTLNRDEASILCGELSEQQYANKHNITLICRKDQDGTWLYQANKLPVHLPIYPVKLVDTIGAGDAHCGGTLAGLSAGFTLEEAVDLGNKVASIVVSKVGGNGAPCWKEILKK